MKKLFGFFVIIRFIFNLIVNCVCLEYGNGLCRWRVHIIFRDLHIQMWHNIKDVNLLFFFIRGLFFVGVVGPEYFFYRHHYKWNSLNACACSGIKCITSGVFCCCFGAKWQKTKEKAAKMWYLATHSYCSIRWTITKVYIYLNW